MSQAVESRERPNQGILRHGISRLPRRSPLGDSLKKASMSNNSMDEIDRAVFKVATIAFALGLALGFWVSRLTSLNG